MDSVVKRMPERKTNDQLKKEVVVQIKKNEKKTLTKKKKLGFIPIYKVKYEGTDPSEHKVHIITSVAKGDPIRENFYKSIKLYEAKCNGKSSYIVRPNAVSRLISDIDDKLKDELLITTDTPLNSNIYIDSVELSQTKKNPLTGLAGFGQSNGSVIFGFCNQTQSVVPNDGKPHIMATTGSLTKSVFKDKEERGKVAKLGFEEGAVIVETPDNKTYHIRMVQADKKGSFIDLCTQYNADGTTERVDAAAMVFGDLHPGDTSLQALRAQIEMAKFGKVHDIFLHDAFNGGSVNPHIKDDVLQQLRNLSNGTSSLRKDLMGTYEMLDLIHREVPKAVLNITQSNHDEWLYKILAAGKFLTFNTENADLLAEILVQFRKEQKALDIKNSKPQISLNDCKDSNGIIQLNLFPEVGPDRSKSKEMPNILEIALRIVVGKELPYVNFLSRNEPFKIAETEFAKHGHDGANGGRPSLETYRLAYTASVTAHTHTPGKRGKAYCVGTATYLDLLYNHGLSSWVQGGAFFYPNSQVQLVNVVDGKWRM